MLPASRTVGDAGLSQHDGRRLLNRCRVLRDTGNIYIQCGPTISHHFKLLMEAVFGAGRFQSEIAWKRNSVHSDGRQGRRRHRRIRDLLLLYMVGRVNQDPRLCRLRPRIYRQLLQTGEPETSRRFRIGDLAVPSWVTKGNPRYEFLGVTRNCRCGEERMKEVVERAVLFRPTLVHASIQALLRLKARAADARTMDGHQAHPIGLLGTGELCHPETPCSLGAHRQRE